MSLSLASYHLDINAHYKRLGCLGLYKLPAHILDVKPVGFGGLVVPEPNER